ncbi:MAG TPA: 2-polyprenyl-3-methyl-6-methoxy-1,4-benzoquinone monooxygenase [Steroidobacteraceae bacterium]|nr:2-polyprenyl-3-methyl-6-methoxy-1,4-benzoquinone monooxygenase [Steroidobacteraceae bacterium]
MRRLSRLDRLLSIIDQGLRAVSGDPQAVGGSGRPAPQPATPAPGPAPGSEAARHAAGLMRVNHAGEIAAQALYHGQALVARDLDVRAFLLTAAREEGDHLIWCAERLRALHSRPSLLSPVWYAGAIGIGALAGLLGDRLSLGFITETERQVEGHIDEHLARLPAEDGASRAILEQMKSDEIRHGERARARGGTELPAPARALMRATAKLMTVSAYWI